ncbi:unnamed protein product [Calicophoron daubneyi]|uniref:Doublecortin domain-containing protein n=1 Tax=Calicophoron daubneyi TaxID=300641 RepID=A0AAV2TQ09_CALDB
MPCNRRCYTCLCRMRAAEGDEAKTMCFVVHRNGDVFNPGHRVFINPRATITWVAFLEQLRRKIGQYFHAIKEILNAKTLAPVNDFTGLENGGRYVAIPRGEKIKTIDYEKVDSMVLHPKRHWTSTELFRRRWNHRHQILYNIHGRLREGWDKKPRTILVYRNGDIYTPAIRVLLRPLQLMDFELVMRGVQDSVFLPENKPVRRRAGLTNTI